MHLSQRQYIAFNLDMWIEQYAKPNLLPCVSKAFGAVCIMMNLELAENLLLN